MEGSVLNNLIPLPGLIIDRINDHLWNFYLKKWQTQLDQVNQEYHYLFQPRESLTIFKGKKIERRFYTLSFRRYYGDLAFNYRIKTLSSYYWGDEEENNICHLDFKTGFREKTKYQLPANWGPFYSIVT